MNDNLQLAGPRDVPNPEIQLVAPREGTDLSRRYINAQGQITNYETVSNGYAASFAEMGSGIGGESGIPGVKNPAGYLNEMNKNSFFWMWQHSMDKDHLAAVDPEYKGPVSDDKLDTVSGQDYYKSSVPTATKQFLEQYGYGSNNLVGNTARESQDKLAQALWMSYNQQREAQYQAEAGGWSKTGRFLTVDLLGGAVLDPTTYASFGAGAVAKIGGKTAIVQGLKTGTAEYLVKAAGRGAVVPMALRDLAASETRQEFARIMGRTYVKASLVGTAVAAQERLQASQHESNQQRLYGDFTQYDTVEGAALAAGIGTGLAWLGHSMFGADPHGVSKTNAEVLMGTPPMEPVIQRAKDLMNPEDAAKFFDVNNKAQMIQAAMQDAKRDPLAFKHLWASEDALAKFESVGISAEDIAKKVREFPSDKEMADWFNDLHTMADQKAVAPTESFITPKYVQDTPVKFGAGKHEMKINFGNEVDKAFYLLAQGAEKIGKDEAARISLFLKAKFPNLADNEIRSLAFEVNSQAKEGAKAAKDVFLKAKAANPQTVRPEYSVTAPIHESMIQGGVKVLEADKIKNVKLSPMTAEDLKTRTFEFASLQKELEPLVKDRDKIRKTLDTENPDMMKLYTEAQKKIDKLERKMAEIRGDNTGLAGKTEIPVVEGSRHLDGPTTDKVLDAILGGRTVDYTLRMAGALGKPIKKMGVWLNSTVAGNGFYHTYFSDSQRVREMSNWIMGSGIMKDAQNLKKRVLSLQQRRHMIDAKYGGMMSRIRGELRKNGFTIPTEESNNAMHLALRDLSVFEQITEMVDGKAVIKKVPVPPRQLGDPKLQAIYNFAQKEFKAFNAEVRARGYKTNMLGGEPNLFYAPAYLKKDLVRDSTVKWDQPGAIDWEAVKDSRIAQEARVRELGAGVGMIGKNASKAIVGDSATFYNLVDDLHQWAAKQWLSDGADLHQGTLKELGIKFDEVRQTTEGGKVPQTYYDLRTHYPEYAKRYADDINHVGGAIGPPPKGEGANLDQNLGGTLWRESHEYARLRSGNGRTHWDSSMVSTVDKSGKVSLKQDSSQSRTQFSSFFNKEQNWKYLDNDVFGVMRTYTDDFFYKTVRQELVRDITGRADISWDKFMDWYEKTTLNPLTGSDDARNQLAQAFKILRDKEAFLGARVIPNDSELFAAPAAAGRVAMNLMRSAISSFNGVQQIATEVVPVVIRGGLDTQTYKDLFFSMMDAFKGDTTTIHGFSYVVDQFRHQAIRGAYDFEPGLSMNQGWVDGAILKPAKRVAHAWSSSEGTGRKMLNATVAGSDAVAQFSRNVGLEDQINTFTKMFNVRRQEATFSKNWDAIKKLSNLRNSFAGNMTEKEFLDMARRAGIPQQDYALRLANSGMLDEGILGILQRADDIDPTFLSKLTERRTFDENVAHDIMMKMNRVEADAFGKALEHTHGFIESVVDRMSVRPEVADLHTPEVNTFATQMRRFLTTWQTAYFNKAVLDGMGNAPWYKAYGLFGLAMSMEFMFFNMKKYMYRGYDIQELKDEYEDNPMQVMYDYGTRTNLLGPMGDIAYTALGTIGGLETELTTGGGTQIATGNGIAMVRSLGRLTKSLVDDTTYDNRKEGAKAKDVNMLVRAVPGMNTPFIQAISKMTGHKSFGHWVTGEE